MTVSELGQRLGRDRKLGGTMRLLLHHSSAEWPSFSKALSGENENVMEDLCSILTSEPLHSLHLQMCGLLKSCVIQCFSCNEVCSHRLGPTGKWRKLS